MCSARSTAPQCSAARVSLWSRCPTRAERGFAQTRTLDRTGIIINRSNDPAFWKHSLLHQTPRVMRQPPTQACRILLIICFSIFSNTFVNAQVAVKNYSACTIKVAICWSDHPGCTWEYDPQCDVEPICYSSQTFAPSTFATMASSCFPTTMACWIEVYDDSNNELIDLWCPDRSARVLFCGGTLELTHTLVIAQ